MAERFIKKGQGDAEDRPEVTEFGDDDFQTAFPVLAEYLTLEGWSDGTPRQTATLLLFCEGGVWKGCLNDRENERSCWASGVVLDGLLKDLDSKLACGFVEWRRSGGWKGKDKGKRR